MVAHLSNRYHGGTKTPSPNASHAAVGGGV